MGFLSTQKISPQIHQPPYLPLQKKTNKPLLGLIPEFFRSGTTGMRCHISWRLYYRTNFPHLKEPLPPHPPENHWLMIVQIKLHICITKYTLCQYMKWRNTQCCRTTIFLDHDEVFDRPRISYISHNDSSNHQNVLFVKKIEKYVDMLDQ